MNKVILMGRLTRDPEVRYSQGSNQTAVARFSIAVERVSLMQTFSTVHLLDARQSS